MTRHLRKGRIALKNRRRVAFDNLTKRLPMIESEVQRYENVSKITDVSASLKHAQKRFESASVEFSSLKNSLSL